MSDSRKILILNGLSCANCAAKIEREIQALPNIKFASLDFVTKKLTIEANKADMHQVVDKASKIAIKIESDIKIFEDEKHAETEATELFNKKDSIIFVIGTALFFVAMLFNFSFWIKFSLFFISYILLGGEVILKAVKNIFKGNVFDENFLMSIATIGAFAIQEFPEGVAVMLFYRIGEFFQDLAVNRSRKSIKALMDIRPDFANLKRENNVIKVSPYDVVIGDIILVKPGEKVPLDGIVIDGYSMLDTSALTGESLPREVEAGSSVLSGSINQNGLLTIEATKEFKESTVSKILELTQNASSKKAKTETLITTFARYYTPIVVLAALSLAVIPPLILPSATFSQWINRALIFLVVSCPCALVISIPLGFFGGIGGASKNGILIKGSNYLEALNNVSTVVFDKTGTLTKGIFKVTKVIPFNNVSKEALLEYGALAESYSNHPIALSIMKAYGKDLDKSKLKNHKEIPGYGVKVEVNGLEIIAGNSKLMAKENIEFHVTDEIGTIVHLALNNKYAGCLVISDEVKADSKNAITALKEIGVKSIVMLTGDSAKTAKNIGTLLGLNEVYADLLPHEKVEKLESLERSKPSKGKLVFVGDGINDAPVLAQADIGVAMGGLGSDAAIEAADIVLMTDEPTKLITAIRIAKRTRNIVWQNIIFAISIKLLVLILGASGMATMWEAVFADVGVALIAVLNATRAMKLK